MAQLPSIVKYLDSLLSPSTYEDAALNGLQVDGRNLDIQLVATAVDAGESVIAEAIKAEADLLIVHHGLFWGSENAITGPFGRKIHKLLKAGCSLYASHLPLDGHREVGNGFELGRFLELDKLEPFCEYGGATVGARGTLTKPQPLEYFTSKASEMIGASSPLALPFGSKEISSVGIVTGSGSMAIQECANKGIDLLISGEPKQEAYHTAKELGVNALFVGHYASETFGVRALGSRLAADFDVSTQFIDEPTGI